jgi:hypothetical protein
MADVLGNTFGSKLAVIANRAPVGISDTFGRQKAAGGEVG